MESRKPETDSNGATRTLAVLAPAPVPSAGSGLSNLRGPTRQLKQKKFNHGFHGCHGSKRKVHDSIFNVQVDADGFQWSVVGLGARRWWSSVCSIYAIYAKYAIYAIFV